MAELYHFSPAPLFVTLLQRLHVRFAHEMREQQRNALRASHAARVLVESQQPVHYNAWRTCDPFDAKGTPGAITTYNPQTLCTFSLHSMNSFTFCERVVLDRTGYVASRCVCKSHALRSRSGCSGKHFAKNKTSANCADLCHDTTVSHLFY